MVKFLEMAKFNPFSTPFNGADCSASSSPGSGEPEPDAAIPNKMNEVGSLGRSRRVIPSRNIMAAAASGSISLHCVFRFLIGICVVLLIIYDNWTNWLSSPETGIGLFYLFVSSGPTGQVEFGSAKYYFLCAIGGAASCGLTHTLVTPLDLVKCRVQVDPAKYKGLGNGLVVTLKEEGVRALAKGWAPTFIGYSLQGMFKFGFYEMFKKIYSNMLSEENAYLWRTSVYLAASASAEFFADIALSPFEAMKVRIQTMPGWAGTMREAYPRLLKEEGVGGFYKSLVPLWGRQIPYTMMKFASFEKTVEILYKHVVRKPRDQTSKGEQLVVTFAAGYIAGVFCAVVSHPADTLVSQLNKEKSKGIGDIVKDLGWKGLWGGIGPRIFMVGTLTALQWFIYDGVKVALNLPRPPPPQPPASLRGKVD